MTEHRVGRRVASAGAAALLLLMASCCPVPAGVETTPTAFSAVLIQSQGDSWVAEASDGTRHRVAGTAPGPEGSRLYLEGTIDASGIVTVDRASVIATP